MKKMKTILAIGGSMIMMFLFFVSIQSILAWTGPPGDPPGSPGYVPDEDYTVKLTVGDTPQQKTGLLTLTASNIGLIVNPGKLGAGTALPGGLLGLDNANTFIDNDVNGGLVFTDTHLADKSLSKLFDSGNYFANGGNTAGMNRILGNNDSAYLALETNNANKIWVDGDGWIGINDEVGGATLVVGGALRLGWDGRACSASIEGVMRYNATTTVVEYCNGSVWN